MFFAINSKTCEKVNSITIENNPSYPFIKEEIWFADPDEIESCPKELDINKIKVNFRTGATDVINWNGTKYDISPCFFILNKERLGINTISESKEHKLAKNWAYNKITKKEAKKTTLIINYSEVNKPYKYKNSINLFDLPIDYEKVGVEVNSSTFGKKMKRRADVICPFIIKHPILKNGIVFEFQFSSQKEKTKIDKELDWAIRGYSIAWLYKEDFEQISESNIALKKEGIDVDSFANLIKQNNKKYVRDLKFTVRDLSRQINEKKEEIKEFEEDISRKSEEKIKSIKRVGEELTESSNKIIENTKNQIEEFFESKIKNISDNFQDEITRKIQGDFFKNNVEEIEEIIHIKVSHFLKEDKLKELKEELINGINFDDLILEVKNKIYEELKPKIEAIILYNELIENAPKCPECGFKKIPKHGKYGLFYGCLDYKICPSKPIPLPPKMKKLLENELW